MKIATLTLAHDHPEIVNDTLSSIQQYVSKENVVIVDKAGVEKFSGDVGFTWETGLYHNHRVSPYRNSVLGVDIAHQRFPDADWYLYFEYDGLVLNDDFMEDVERATHDGVWAMGNELRGDNDFDLPLLAEIVGKPFKSIYHFGGFCQFFHRDFIKCLADLNFFDNFLKATEGFEKGYFPQNSPRIPAFEEELWATLAGNLGGFERLRELAGWEAMFCFGGNDSSPQLNKCRGDWERYPMRFRPEIAKEEVTDRASMVHPCKEYDHPVREMARARRRREFGSQHVPLAV